MITLVQDSMRALVAFAEHHRKRGVATILLQPLFNRLDLATRLHLAQTSMITLCAATMEAQKRWGETGGVLIRDNTLLVGVYEGGSLLVRGSGRTLQEAFAQVDEGEP